MAEPINYAGWIPDITWARDKHGAYLRHNIGHWNFVWLLFPELDETLMAPRKQGVTLDHLAPVFDHMDQDTLNALGRMPDSFMDYWEATDNGDLEILQDLYPYLNHDYTKVMGRRAQEAMLRFCPPLSNSVVWVDFTQRRVIGG